MIRVLEGEEKDNRLEKYSKERKREKEGGREEGREFLKAVRKIIPYHSGEKK